MSLKDHYFLGGHDGSGAETLDWMSQVFQMELERLDQAFPASQRFAHLYYNTSQEAMLLGWIIDKTADVETLRKVNATLVDEILDRSPENLSRITAQWQSFTDVFFIRRGRPVPEWRQYVEIQEALGLVGRSSYNRYGRSMRRLGQSLLVKVLEVVSQRYPDWNWAAQKHCYLTAALVTEYFLPNREVSCIPEH